jgi:membrane protein YqaA with SNARE-associated domain
VYAVTAYLTLFAWSFLAASILPFASEPMLIALVRAREDFAAPVAVATAGNYLGACTTYLLARAAARRLAPVSRTVTAHQRAVALVERFGQPALLLSWVPLIGDAIVVVAGGVGIRFLPFSLWVVAGKLARYSAVAWLARSL